MCDAVRHMDMIEALRRGLGRVLRAEEDGMALCVCGTIGMLTASTLAAQQRLLPLLLDFPLIVVHQPESEALLSVWKPKLEKMCCHQAVFDQQRTIHVPHVEGINLRTITMAEHDAVAELYAQYHDPSEIVGQIKAGAMLGAYAGETLAGFVGMHEEGSIGMLQVADGFRRRGIAACLESAMIQRELEKGNVPFCQVMEHNDASLALQRKLGMTVTNEPCLTWFMA